MKIISKIKEFFSNRKNQRVILETPEKGKIKSDFSVKESSLVKYTISANPFITGIYLFLIDEKFAEIFKYLEKDHKVTLTKKGQNELIKINQTIIDACKFPLLESGNIKRIPIYFEVSDTPMILLYTKIHNILGNSLINDICSSDNELRGNTKFKKETKHLLSEFNIIFNNILMEF